MPFILKGNRRYCSKPKPNTGEKPESEKKKSRERSRKYKEIEDKKMWLTRKEENRLVKETDAQTLLALKTVKAMSEHSILGKINSECEWIVENAILQFTDGNKSAGIRARKAAIELEKLLKEFRRESMEFTRHEDSSMTIQS